MSERITKDEIDNTLESMGEKAKLAAYVLAVMSASDKNRALNVMADSVENECAFIMSENLKDLKVGEKKGLSAAMLDRLKLDKERIKAMADGLRDVASLEDPVGKILTSSIRPNGLKIDKVTAPIGVIGIVYESRPNVTVDAAGLCMKAGNCVLLRGGSEAIHSNLALAHCLSRAALSSGLPEGVIQLIPWSDRRAVSKMLTMDRYIDLIIPRGGEGLIRAVVEQSTIPVIKHYKGICHIYVDSECDQKRAIEIIENSKCQRPGVCNAIETLLINHDIAAEFAPKVAARLIECGVELRGNSEFRKFVPDAKPAIEEDWYEEYLDLILAVKVVSGVDEAIAHINRYGSGHSEAILTTLPKNAEKFMNEVDSAVVYMNASTRFTDGGEFGMGAEIGISTDKLHARGPMGLPELTTYKYLIYGEGQIR